MKVKELIAALQLCDQELEVYSYCDHGQSPEKADVPSMIYTTEDAFCLWDEYSHDADDADEYGYTHKAIML
jgi:hypothetical protein